ncbi:hypothetical protein EVAR_13152_1 [Eumeta japonica]|uniref:Uncharacterized protein n=1 Tax=Eumeta variegata TaxID=151549 RepID=A0A4C1U9T6_EUMVA|nr:hypothetical protein EVAR_13152_1 [Eumeta japonica]
MTKLTSRSTLKGSERPAASRVRTRPYTLFTLIMDRRRISGCPETESPLAHLIMQSCRRPRPLPAPSNLSRLIERSRTRRTYLSRLTLVIKSFLSFICSLNFHGSALGVNASLPFRRSRGAPIRVKPLRRLGTGAVLGGRERRGTKRIARQHGRERFRLSILRYGDVYEVA